MSLLDRYMILELGDKQPHFDKICVVCKGPCADSDAALLPALKAGMIPGAVLFKGGRLFNVPGHLKPRKCARKLKLLWWVSTYTAAIVTIFYTVVMLSFVFSLHLRHASYAWFYLPSILAVGIVAFIVQVYYSTVRLSVGIQEKSKAGQYSFTFDDASYAKVFRELNDDTLKKDS